MLIWGHKTIAMLDLWSIEHFINGIWCGYVANLLIKKASNKLEINPKSERVISFLFVLAASMVWECIEHYLESGILPGVIGERVTYWFWGVEHWSNRLIGDPITVMLGWYIYYKFPKLAFPAKIFSTVWLVVHIFVFPDSMYLHRLIFG